MFNQGSFILPSSFHPPDLPALNATSLRRPGSPAWVFLDSTAYIAERENGTFAATTTRTGETLGVSSWLADPPALSHLCIHCSGIKVTDLQEEPIVVCAGKDIAVIRVAYTYGARRLESMEDLGTTDLDYFVYRAHAGKPTLHLLPNPKPLFFHAREVGLLPSVDGEDFLMAVVHPRRVRLQYDLHIFSSKTNRWTTKLALLEPPSPRYKTEYLVHQTDKVITLEGGILGWVDLWRGIMICDVLANDPVMHYIKFPDPMVGNVCGYLESPARSVRDVICCNGFIKFVEIEERNRLVVPAAPSNVAGLESENAMGSCTSESVLDGWKAVSWDRKTTDHWSKEWRRDCRAYVSESSILSLLRHNNPQNSALESLLIVGPVWNIREEDVCYLMAKTAFEDKNAWAIAIDMRKNTLEGLTLLSAERELFFKLAYHPFALSKSLSMTSDDRKAAAGSHMQERGDSSNDPRNTMVFVEVLDSFVTENHLKEILAMFGDLRLLKFHENEQYGVVQFANRSCAEEAISALNGAQIGRPSFHLSWKPSILNKQAHQKSSSGLNGVRYHPYARLHGVDRNCNTLARDNRVHAAPVAAATHCSTRGSTLLPDQMCLAPVAANTNTNQE